MKNKETTLKIKKQKHIKMNDEQNNEFEKLRSKDNQLKSFIERIERLEEEKYNVLLDIKEVYSEAKSSGYVPKIMRNVLTIWKIDTYKNALGIF